MHDTMFDDLDGAAVDRAYRLWAPIYDIVYGGTLEQARRAAAEAARSVGGDILEIGIGTGLSFDHYRHPGIRLYGIDLCADMLALAQKKVATARYPYVAELAVMDAQELAYPDGFFDCAVAQFVITLVARPEQVLSECARVIRPGGEIILVSHFSTDHPLLATIERIAAPPLRKLGLRPEFPLARLMLWAERDGRAKLIDTRKLGRFGSYTLVRFRRL